MWDHTKTTTQRGYGHDWRKQRSFILKRDNYLCVPCSLRGKLTMANAVDHITPKAEGGTDEPSNLQAICKECHTVKTVEDSGKSYQHGCDSNGLPKDPKHHWN